MKYFFSLGLVLASLPLRAGGSLSLQWIPQARMEYEGTGYREDPQGWELKVKPWTPVAGIRWRQDLPASLALQTQYWINRKTYAEEFGNSASETEKQTGQTALSFQSLWVDLRHALWQSPVEAVGGVNGVYQTFHRKEMVFGGVPEQGESLETQTALGVHMGFHAGGEARGFYWDGEALLGHYLWTRNKLTTGGGSIDRGGYTYILRLEGGLVLGRARIGLGYSRQLYEILAPGGRSLPNGSAVSLPINKTDLFGPFLTAGWTY